MTSFPLRINLGCGGKKVPGCLNVDRVAPVKPDVVHDLNQHPWPYPDQAFEEVLADDVIEHLEDVAEFMREVWRIRRPSARIHITTPHYSCANSFTDPTHRQHPGYSSLEYFTVGHQSSFYGSSGFAIRHRALVFAPSLVNKVVHRLANRFPHAYEQRWGWLFPAWFLSFEWEVLKDG